MRVCSVQHLGQFGMYFAFFCFLATTRNDFIYINDTLVQDRFGTFTTAGCSSGQVGLTQYDEMATANMK